MKSGMYLLRRGSGSVTEAERLAVRLDNLLFLAGGCPDCHGRPY